MQCCLNKLIYIKTQIKTLPSVLQEAPNNTAEVKTLCNIVLAALDNNAQKKVPFNVILIFLGQHFTGQNPMHYCPRGSR